MTNSKYSVVVVLLIGVCASHVFGKDIPEDLDPRAQIAQYNNEDGQLRVEGPDADEDANNTFDQVSNEEDIEDLRSRPEFPPSLEFNFERNRVHKRIPVLEEDYDVSSNQMDQINKEA